MKHYIALLLLSYAPWAAAQTGGAFFGTFAQPPDPNFTLVSEAGAVMDANTGEILWSKAPTYSRMMASTTKAMTLLLAVEYCNATLDTHTVTASVAAEGQPGSEHINVGDIFTMRNLLYSILPSSNDGMWMIAEHIGGAAHLNGGAGNEAATFIARMNSRAAELGMADTSFANPHGGLDADAATHYTTVIDLLILGRAAMNLTPGVTVPATLANVVLRSRWHGLKEAGSPSGPATVWYSGMPMNCYYAGSIGIKAGSTAGSGVHYLVAARRNGRTLISATLNADTGPNTRIDHAKMLDYGFQTIGLHGYPSSANCQERTPTIVYAGSGWSTTDSMSSVYDESYARISLTTDDTATLPFRGTGIEWWSNKSSTRGITEVSIDDVVVANIDAYDAAGVDGAALYTNLSLPWGAHTIKVRVTGTKNAASTNFYTAVDAFKVYQ